MRRVRRNRLHWSDIKVKSAKLRLKGLVTSQNTCERTQARSPSSAKSAESHLFSRPFAQHTCAFILARGLTNATRVMKDSRPQPAAMGTCLDTRASCSNARTRIAHTSRLDRTMSLTTIQRIRNSCQLFLHLSDQFMWLPLGPKFLEARRATMLVLKLHCVHFNKTSSNRRQRPQAKGGQNISEIYPQASPLTPPAASNLKTSLGSTNRVHLAVAASNSLIYFAGKERLLTG